MRHTLLTIALAVAAPAAFAETPLHVPSDPKASYMILQRDTQGVERTITTKREGSSGTTYSKRLYNCAEHTVKYLGSGESIEQMNASSPDPKMAPVISGSIADFVGEAVCG